MNRLKNVLAALAFVFAVGASFATMTVRSGWFDSNGTATGGGFELKQVPIACDINNINEICTVADAADGGAFPQTQPLYDTEATAVANAGNVPPTSMTGLLRKP